MHDNMINLTDKQIEAIANEKLKEIDWYDGPAGFVAGVKWCIEEFNRQQPPASPGSKPEDPIRKTIREAYGDFWELVKNHVDELGWVRDVYCGKDHCLAGLECDWRASSWCRPVSLRSLDIHLM